LEKLEVPMKVMYFADRDIKIMQISVGVDISMVVTTTGEVYGWGCTKNGRIGINNTTEADFISLPEKVEIKTPDGEPMKAVDVECGYVHSVVVGCDGTLHMCGFVDLDGADETSPGNVNFTPGSETCPTQLPDFNIWHRLPEPKGEEKKKAERWKSYGTYQTQGRSAMLAARNAAD